jgi:hypothetical protein
VFRVEDHVQSRKGFLEIEILLCFGSALLEHLNICIFIFFGILSSKEFSL